MDGHLRGLRVGSAAHRVETLSAYKLTWLMIKASQSVLGF